MILLIPAVLVGCLIGALLTWRLNHVHYRQRWLEAIGLINTLQEELETLPEPVAPPLFVTRNQPAPREPWKVSARRIAGVTSIYARRGPEKLELERVAINAPDYEVRFAQALARARRTVQAKNGR